MREFERREYHLNPDVSESDLRDVGFTDLTSETLSYTKTLNCTDELALYVKVSNVGSDDVRYSFGILDLPYSQPYISIDTLMTDKDCVEPNGEFIFKVVEDYYKMLDSLCDKNILTYTSTTVLLQKRGKILAIDPGTEKSGYVIVEHNEEEILKVIECGKIDNHELLSKIYGLRYGMSCTCRNTNYRLVIEKMTSYGARVGREVFDTCVWMGRFEEAASNPHLGRYGFSDIQYVDRREEKKTICGTIKANDSTVAQALISKYAPDTSNRGKGTKKSPGFFYGFAGDMWQAFAVAVTYFTKVKRQLGGLK